MLRVPAIQGVIERRVLVNFRIDPEAMAAKLPAPFRPKLVGGYAIGGICLIRLAEIRPVAVPLPCGLSSENAAHRIAVEWDTPEGVQEGVYIPRRDTDSLLNSLVGGRLFPGVHHHARFVCEESPERYSIEMQADDGSARIKVRGVPAEALPEGSVFEDLAAASRFFELGSLGYSETATPGEYDGLELRCEGWAVEPLAVEEVESSYFSEGFSPDQVAFDNALLMRDIQHEWHSRKSLCATPN